MEIDDPKPKKNLTNLSNRFLIDFKQWLTTISLNDVVEVLIGQEKERIERIEKSQRNINR